MAGKLVALTGVVKGLILRFEEGNEWVVGRDPETSQLLVEDPSVSRSHIRVSSTEEGLFVENVSETNPALVNGELIEEKHLLKEGDRLQLGNQELFFTFEEPPEVTAGEDSTPMPVEEVASEVEEEEDEPSRTSILGDEESEMGLTEVHFDLLETGRWVLKVVGGPNNGAEFPLQSANSYVIGTDPASCDIVFHDISVSRQHARLTLADEDQLMIEDLGSRNGLFVDDNKIEGKVSLEPSKLVTLGTSTFVVLDVEGERNTIISPLLPSIVKVLQKQESKGEEGAAVQERKAAAEKEAAKPKFSLFGAFILIALVSGLFAIIGLGLATLFRSEEIEKHLYDYDKEISAIVDPYSSLRYSFNEPTGRLLLVGHVLTSVDRSQLNYRLQALPFVKQIDDNIIIDELVWREINQVLAKNPSWRGVAMIAPNPGQFILTGYLTTRAQGESLSEYINQNFSYPDLLENRVVVEEDLLTRASIVLRNNGLSNVRPSFTDGDLKLSGTMPFGAKEQLAAAIVELSKVQGVRNVQNLVAEQRPSESLVNLSDRYKVSGMSDQGGESRTVVINGRILSVGDAIDGLTVTSISPESVFLERAGVKYKIDYNK